jgi:hypothetical protein
LGSSADSFYIKGSRQWKQRKWTLFQVAWRIRKKKKEGYQTGRKKLSGHDGFGSNSTGIMILLSFLKEGFTKPAAGLEYDLLNLWHKLVSRMAMAYHYTIAHISRRDLEATKNALLKDFRLSPDWCIWVGTRTLLACLPI